MWDQRLAVHQAPLPSLTRPHVLARSDNRSGCSERGQIPECLGGTLPTAGGGVGCPPRTPAATVPVAVQYRGLPKPPSAIRPLGGWCFLLGGAAVSG